MKHRDKLIEFDPYIDDYAVSSHFQFSTRVDARHALKNKVDDLIEQARREGIEEAIAFILNGVFLTDTSPAKLFANEVTAEMRKQLL
jgi:hypothetical protein